MWKQWLKRLHPKYQVLIPDYPVHMVPRYGHGRPTHAGLAQLLANETSVYEKWLSHILSYANSLQQIGMSPQLSADSLLPGWNNGFLPGLDMAMLYTAIRELKPKTYVEVGSGNSTRLVHQAKLDGALDTRIISIDPHPRAVMDELADEIIRQPFEFADLSLFKNLVPGDIVFIDNSHRVLPNSDATVFFLDILPYLPVGVWVQIHDIYLPDDYPQVMCDRFYSEQYVLAAFILANPTRYKTRFPAWYVSQVPALADQVAPLFSHPSLTSVERHGGSFWLEIGG